MSAPIAPNGVAPATAVARLEPLRPMPVHQVAQAMNEYQAGLQALLADSDWQTFTSGGDQKRFVKRSGWRKIGTWFGLDVTIGRVELERDERGQLLRARVVARAIAPNGRVFEDVGACSHAERRFSKPEHDILATAATRAINRAMSDLVGMGEITSDEMLDPDTAEIVLPEWAEYASSERVADMRSKLDALVGDERGGVLANALAQRYDGVPNIAAGVVNALHSMLAQREPEPSTIDTTEAD